MLECWNLVSFFTWSSLESWVTCLLLPDFLYSNEVKQVKSNSFEIFILHCLAVCPAANCFQCVQISVNNKFYLTLCHLKIHNKSTKLDGMWPSCSFSGRFRLGPSSHSVQPPARWITNLYSMLISRLLRTSKGIWRVVNHTSVGNLQDFSLGAKGMMCWPKLGLTNHRWS